MFVENLPVLLVMTIISAKHTVLVTFKLLLAAICSCSMFVRFATYVYAVHSSTCFALRCVVHRYSWDVTAATWGGSTAHTMESEGSEYSAEGFDTSRDVGEHGEDALHALAGQLLASQYLQMGEQEEYLSSRPTAGT